MYNILHAEIAKKKIKELNDLRQDWDPHAQMQLNDGFKVVRRKQRSPRKVSDDLTHKKQKMVVTETSNQFDNLTIEEPPDFLVEPENIPIQATRATVRPNMATAATATQAAPRKERPVPPITIDNIPRKDLLIKQLIDLTSGRITARIQGTLSEVFPPKHTPAVESSAATPSSIGASLSAFNAPPCRDLLALVNGFIQISNSTKSRLEKLNEVMALLGEDMSL
ncbi:hypothetical protein NPIL_296401 [Nephila pilipes]|uniref:Uncharacterized protein n=1 Tax=Nephila pilipes TaxID=299642 RepID=A0A8X6T672_NEPPI|nr:hypothetical protein NPIL_296401 [Nephila pilipes]